MEVVFRVHLIAAVFFTWSYGATFDKYDFSDRKYGSNELDARKVDREELPSDYNNISEINTHNKSCPIHPKPADCAEVFENGFKNNGVYEVYPRNKIVSCGAIRVYCDMETDGGGWTVIQRRGNFKRSPDYFDKAWNEYKTGFGSLEDEFWLGNDNIYALTNQKRYTARFDLGIENETAYATYDTFWIENEELKYRLYISDYKGTAGESMMYHQSMNFSTKDRKNTPPGSLDCPKIKKGGWWYNYCTSANLNGLYPTGNYDEATVTSNGTYWRGWKGYKKSMIFVEIKIRPFVYPI